jgi:alkylation response protein AidB-like acyl-CoA dehydrogenase
MSFSFTDEQREFRDVLRRYLEDRAPVSEVRRLMATETGWEREGWQQLNQELGLAGIHIPEAYGGQGFGFVELGIVCEEMGRALLCAPFFASSVMAGCAILNAGSEEKKRELLPGIALGETVATLAVAEDGGQWDADGVSLTATPDGDSAILNGHKSFVLDGHSADTVIVVARAPGTQGEDGVGFYAVAGDAAGLGRRALVTQDPTRKLARLEFDNVTATPIGTGDGAAALARTLDQCATCLASEMVGGAERLREDSLEYVMLRMQFGRTIASFQTMKHRAADMLLEVENAKSAAYYAAGAADRDDGDLPAAASLAKACAGETYVQTGVNAIQMHGGIGFTWDNDTHLWFKRAKSSQVLLGDSAWHRERMLQHWDALEAGAA